MLIRQARQAARRWVEEEGWRLPGFQGAYLAGSTAVLPDDAALPSTSDVDLMIVQEGSSAPAKLGKTLFESVLLDITFLAADALASPEQVLSDYHLGAGFRHPAILDDPSGRLARLGAVVSGEFAHPRWVRARCEHARDRVIRNVKSIHESVQLIDRVDSWLFAAGVTAHILLVAGLRNPTIRRRYAAVKDLLDEHGRSACYPALLELVGCAGWSRSRTERHLAALEKAFDAASSVLRTPFPFASDITDTARPIAIDGSRELIEQGLHREAVFWILATFTRCLRVQYCDAPRETGEGVEAGYGEMLSDLGIDSPSDLPRRGDGVTEALPRITGLAEAMMAANPEITNRSVSSGCFETSSHSLEC